LRAGDVKRGGEERRKQKKVRQDAGEKGMEYGLRGGKADIEERVRGGCGIKGENRRRDRGKAQEKKDAGRLSYHRGLVIKDFMGRRFWVDHVQKDQHEGGG